MMKSITRLSVLMTFAASPLAYAVTIAPGSTSALPGTTAAAEPNLAGLIVQDFTTPFSIVGTNTNTGDNVNITGSVQNRVVHAVDGTYDFYWRVFVDANSSEAVGSFRLGNFGSGSAAYNINYRIDGLGTVAPVSATHFSGSFDTFYNFNFETGIAPGAESLFLFVDTDAAAYAQNASYDLANIGQNPISASFAAFGPAAVPVPAAMPLMLTGLAALGGWRRKARSA